MSWIRKGGHLDLAALLVGSLLASTAWAQASVAPTLETAAAPGSGDPLGDLALWEHPTDPAASLLVAADRQNGGLRFYDLSGAQVGYQPGTLTVGVDVRPHFALGGFDTPLIAVANQGTAAIDFYTLDADRLTLTEVSSPPLFTGLTLVAVCFYVSPVDGALYAFALGSGALQQWQLFDAGAGKVRGTLVRTLSVGSDASSMVADDDTGFLFLSQSSVGLSRYFAEPAADRTPLVIDSVAPAGNGVAPIKGLALYPASDGRGVLLVSSAGDNTFLAYDRREPHSLLTRFQIAAAGPIDAVSGSKAIEVSPHFLGAAFPRGVFIAHDADNDVSSNFKLVPWEAVAATASPPLVIEAGPSTGLDGGSPDGGSLPNSGSQGSGRSSEEGSPKPLSCGCSGGAPGPFLLAALALLLFRRSARARIDGLRVPISALIHGTPPGVKQLP